MQSVFRDIDCQSRFRVEQLPFVFLKTMTLWFNFNLGWPEVSWKPSSLGVRWGGPLEEKKLFFEHHYKKQFCLRGHSLAYWLPWCHATLVNRETGPWFEELSWHLKVPWKLIINVKRIPIHRLAVQIEGGTAAVGFLLSKKLAKDSISVWIEVSNCRVDILVARNVNVLETIKFGCHVGALWQEKKLLFDTITRRIFSQKTMSCFRGHSLRDWLPWCHATSVNRETGPWFEELSWHLKVPWKLIKRIPRHRVPMQIEGGTAAVGFETMTIWLRFSWIEFSNWSWHVGGKTCCGNLRYIII